MWTGSSVPAHWPTKDWKSANTLQVLGLRVGRLAPGVARFLTQFPNLRRVDLAFDHPDTDLAAVEPILSAQFPNVTSFGIRCFPHHLLPILAIVGTSPLVDLRIDLVRPLRCQLDDPTNGVLTHLSRLQPSLRYLSYEDGQELVCAGDVARLVAYANSNERVIKVDAPDAWNPIFAPDEYAIEGDELFEEPEPAVELSLAAVEAALAFGAQELERARRGGERKVMRRLLKAIAPLEAGRQLYSD